MRCVESIYLHLTVSRHIRFLEWIYIVVAWMSQNLLLKTDAMY